LSLQRAELAGLDLDQLADTLAGPHPGTPNHGVAMAEFTRRQTLFQQEAAEAQKIGARAQQDAAEAAKQTALYTRRSAHRCCGRLSCSLSARPSRPASKHGDYG
jgi:hypothetical protein